MTFSGIQSDFLLVISLCLGVACMYMWLCYLNFLFCGREPNIFAFSHGFTYQHIFFEKLLAMSG